MKRKFLIPLIGGLALGAIAASTTLSKKAMAGEKSPTTICSPASVLIVSDTTPSQWRSSDKKTRSNMGSDSTRQWNNGKDSLSGKEKRNGRKMKTQKRDTTNSSGM